MFSEDRDSFLRFLAGYGGKDFQAPLSCLRTSHHELIDLPNLSFSTPLRFLVDTHLIAYFTPQYYCSNFDEKVGYFEVKRGNKKYLRKFYNLLIANGIFFEYSLLAGSPGSNSYPQCPG
jgi:hypothetical protein